MIDTEDIGDLPQHIIKDYSEISLYIDIMHANSIMFLVSASNHIGLIQYVCVSDQRTIRSFLKLSY